MTRLLADAFDEDASAVYRYCLRHVGDPVEAEDLVSVVFLEAWQVLQRKGPPEGAVRPWLFGVAKNVVRNRRRTLRRHSAALGRFHAEDRQVEDHANTVAGHLDRGRDRVALDLAWSSLTARQRDVADLCLAAGVSPSDASEVLGIPEGTVKSRLADARAKLRPLLRTGGPEFGTDPEAVNGHVGVGDVLVGSARKAGTR